jgi:hypothetical protein
MRKIKVALAASVFLLFSSLLYSTNAFSTGIFTNLTGSTPHCSVLSFDRNSCEQDCRSRFGIDMYGLSNVGFRGGSGRGGYYAYAACIQSCNNRFWNDFDRSMRNLERENNQ